MTPQPLVAGMGGRVAGRQRVGAQLEETGIDLPHERDVQPVDPGHRLVGGVVMLVPSHAGREQEVASTHRDRVVVDVGPHPLALDDEAERRLRMAMRRGLLARAEVLDRGPQRGGGVGRAGQARVGESDRPAFSPTADRDELARAGGELVQGRPAPHCGTSVGLGNLRHQAFTLGPQRRKVRGRKIGVELIECCSLVGGVGLGSVR